MNLYPNYNTGCALLYNGANGMANNTTYIAPGGGVNIASGDPIDVLMKYNGGTLTVILTDNVAGTTWTYSYPGVTFTGGGHNVGTNAYLTFTGGTGGSVSTQTITKVYFRVAK